MCVYIARHDLKNAYIYIYGIKNCGKYLSLKVVDTPLSLRVVDAPLSLKVVDTHLSLRVVDTPLSLRVVDTPLSPLIHVKYALTRS